MTTIDDIVRAKRLRKLGVPLSRHEYEDRQIYAYPSFFEWLCDPVKTAVQFYPENIAPRHQAYSLLKDFITGKPMTDTRMFKKMSPSSNDVWEMRSADLRFFGWFYRKDCFVAVSGDFFANLKQDTSIYEMHRVSVLTERTAIDLDDPKYIQGASAHDLLSS